VRRWENGGRDFHVMARPDRAIQNNGFIFGKFALLALDGPRKVGHDTFFSFCN
jgi:hypothetical protein